MDGRIKFRPKSYFKANAEYVLTIKYSKKTTYLLNLSTISNLEQALIELEEIFFILPDSDYDYVEANNMKKRILNISPKILMSMYRADVKMKLVNGPITDEPELNYLRGVVPRGWEGTGMTWDDVPGAGGYEMPIARIGYSEPGIWNNHDTINLELHELAHTVDNYISGDLSEPISFSEQFISIWESEVEHVLNYYYFIEYPEEYFAETFAMYYLSEDSKAKLKALAPMTYDYIKDLDKFTNIKDFD